jgi:AAA family ATPase
VCRRAAFLAMEENLNIDFVYRRHFIEAIRQTPTRITKEMIQFYMDYQAKSSLKGV